VKNADYLYGKRRFRPELIRGFAFSRKRIDAAVVNRFPPAARQGSAATRNLLSAQPWTYKDAAGLEHVVSIVGIDEVDLDPRLHQLALALSLMR